jgi:uncharacterized protein YraI
MKSRFELYRAVAGIAVVCLVASACVPVRYGGIVRGVVYADLNGSGTIEAGEGPLQGATVHLNDCGPATSQITDVEGRFNFINLPEGTCHVSVSKGGWEFTGSYPSLGYPVPVASNPDLPTAFSLFMGPVMDFIPTDTASPTPVASPSLEPSATSVPSYTPTLPPTLVPSATPVEPTATATLPPTLVPSPTPVEPTATATATPVVATATSSEPMLTPREAAVNCRFGPGVEFLTVGALKAGKIVPILGTNSARSWWQIQNPLDIAGHYCWVADSVVLTSGDLSRVPVVPIPVGLVIEVSVDPFPATIYGFCHEPNAFGPRGSITTNGPASVIYHWEIWKDGSLYHATSDATLAFASASTQSLDPGADHGDCGSYVVKLIVTSPNSMSAQQSFTIAAARVTSVTVQPIATLHGYCHEPNAFNPLGSITTNGPASVVYHWEIWKDGSLYHATSDASLAFASASTKSLNPGADHGDCGNYVVKLIVTSPNSKSAQQSFTIVEP